MKHADKPKGKNPDLILTADWHLREDIPSCRIDDFETAQWNKIREISKLQRQFDCHVLHAGDLFHYWKPSPYLISKAIQEIPPGFFSVAGNHDLPQHSLDLVDKSGLYSLHVAGTIDWIKEGGNFGQPVGAVPSFSKVGVWHHFVWDGKELPWPGCEEMTAKKVLIANPEFDLIVTGDHHKPFVYSLNGRLLVNPGCLTRQVADYADHKPRVYFWYADTNTVEPYYLKIKMGVVSREHIEVNEQRDKRIDAFVSRLSDTWEVGLSFEDNLKRFISSNQLRKSIVDLIYKALEN